MFLFHFLLFFCVLTEPRCISFSNAFCLLINICCWFSVKKKKYLGSWMREMYKLGSSFVAEFLQLV